MLPLRLNHVRVSADAMFCADVLIASLTDTLTEHPELVGAARVGLRADLPEQRNAETVEKLLMMNKAQQKTTGR